MVFGLILEGSQRLKPTPLSKTAKFSYSGKLVYKGDGVYELPEAKLKVTELGVFRIQARPPPFCAELTTQVTFPLLCIL